ncbi:acetyl-CoA carboxylase biotin carboxyl carrier protein [Halocella sp. SP3-1]|uniref:acetyl-CoA carboxylase biotin carboxyl carrier protein n=1 Tax=Halocella sp. SP3-1 TaxID=2382161 RepID=UPI000F75494D|nr:acetyl-CoA carboxylase biotin carboxyl carrier protein [Halocella sp. SP3-1]AZO95667.1 acetyl-CoA carboxylase biotin carboxyl carrier protein [Halocella sp. SP3-1]
MNLDEIKALIELIKETDITEINVEEKETKISIKRGFQASEAEQFIDIQRKPSQIEDQGNQEKDDIVDSNREEIVAPMVGTFYRAPAPDVDPFVAKGDIVNPGDTLCIIEAMKLMNEIEVETRGKIVEILVENGQAVEYGEPLFVIEPL